MEPKAGIRGCGGLSSFTDASGLLKVPSVLLYRTAGSEGPSDVPAEKYGSTLRASHLESGRIFNKVEQQSSGCLATSLNDAESTNVERKEGHSLHTATRTDSE